MSRLARAPLRSSPDQVGKPVVGAAARCSGSETMASSKSFWARLVSSITWGSQGWGTWWSVPFIHNMGSSSPDRKPSISAWWAANLRRRAPASAGVAAPLP